MEIVPFKFTHVGSFLRSAQGEGWVTSARELDFLLNCYPEGCLVVLDAGQPIAFISAIRYPKSAWIGNLLVVPEQRCKGLARTLLAKVLNRLDLAGCETVWLTASAAGAHLYRTLGFVALDRVQRWKGSGGMPSSGGKADYSAATAIIDCLGWGDNRRAIFEALPENCRCFSGHAGFLVYSPCGNGQQIGPWGAFSPESAACLLDAAVVTEGVTREVLLDVPEKNHAAGELLAARGFTVLGSTQLMYRGTIPEYRPEFIYSCASMGSYG